MADVAYRSRTSSNTRPSLSNGTAVNATNATKATRRSGLRSPLRTWDFLLVVDSRKRAKRRDYATLPCPLPQAKLGFCASEMCAEPVERH